MDTLVETLGSLPPSKWSARGPGDSKALAHLESEFRVRLPEDLRQLLLYSDGGSLEGPKIELNLESIAGMFGQNSDERFQQGLPGMFVIGDDGVGGVYFYDPEGRLGHGKNALF